MNETLNSFKTVVVHYFTDCAQLDPNATSRLQQEITQRFLTEGYLPIVYVNGVKDDHEAGHCVVDILGRPSPFQTVILANAAPRRDNDRDKAGWHNGTPFGHVWIEGRLVVSTIGGFALSLLKKVRCGDLIIQRTDIAEVAPLLTSDHEEQTWLASTQFRSLDYVPRLAAALLAKKVQIPSHNYTEIPDLGDRVVYVDRPFRNVKLGLCLQDLIDRGFDLEKPFSIQAHARTFVTHFYPGGLTTIPEAQIGLVVGSSGWGHPRQSKLLELQIKKGTAATALQVEAGDLIAFVQLK